MSHRSATHSASFATGVIAGELAALDAGGKAPAWIKVAPAGRVTTRDGRSYGFDAALLVARFQVDGISIPVDLDHSVTLKAAHGDAGTVAGWAPELQARADGLYARVDWLEPGKAALAARTHRYVSPTFHHDDAGNATWLHSIALVPAPALAMPAVASAGSPEEQSMTKKIAVALGLAETADETACLSAITGLSAGKVDKAIHDQALANLTAVTAAKDAAEAKLATLAADGRKVKIDTLLEGALKDRKILPAQREQYAALCATDAGYDQVVALLGITPPNLQPSNLDGKKADDTASADVLANPVMLSAAAAAYVKKQAEAGVTMSHADAVIAITEGKDKK